MSPQFRRVPLGALLLACVLLLCQLASSTTLSPSACPGGCDDFNPCTQDECAGEGVCVHLPALDWSPCGGPPNACNPGGYSCLAGECVRASIPSGVPTLDCDDNLICTDDRCIIHPETGASDCTHTIASDMCLINGNVCAQRGQRAIEDNCMVCDPDASHTEWSRVHYESGGPCARFYDSTVLPIPLPRHPDPHSTPEGIAICQSVHTSLEEKLRRCDAAHHTGSCTFASGCDPARGCLFSSYLDDTKCSHGCVLEGSCQAGQCEPGIMDACSDHNECTEDYCEVSSGTCQHDGMARAGLPCERPDDVCLVNPVCSAKTPGECTSDKTVDCTPADLDMAGYVRSNHFNDPTCTDYVCDPTEGCVVRPRAEGTNCLSGSRCTHSDTCDGLSLECTPNRGTHLSCSPQLDDGPCRYWMCDDALGCVRHNAPDGTACRSSDLCASTEVCQAGTCVLESHVKCRYEDAPVPPYGYCYGSLLCDPAQGCMHAPVDCVTSLGYGPTERFSKCYEFTCDIEEGCGVTFPSRAECGSAGGPGEFLGTPVPNEGEAVPIGDVPSVVVSPVPGQEELPCGDAENRPANPREAPRESVCDDGLSCTLNHCIEERNVCRTTVLPGFCLINGQCYQHHQLNADTGCHICDADALPQLWTRICGPPTPQEQEAIAAMKIEMAAAAKGITFLPPQPAADPVQTREDDDEDEDEKDEDKEDTERKIWDKPINWTLPHHGSPANSSAIFTQGTPEFTWFLLGMGFVVALIIGVLAIGMFR